ncbi:MAG: tRNA (guanine(10)-N(2))-dimethyltransferase, partial [Candidatus Micrarchaeota archaeon]
EAAFRDPFHLPVFYNPAMRFNRSISSLAAGCLIRMLDDSVFVDALCSLGARGIRYAKENRLKKIHFVDANPDAIKVLRKNVKLNKLKNAKIEESDLNKFFINSEEHFDFIEIDPFGSPVLFLQNAIRRLRKKAVLSVTATDLANLAGARIDPCKKHYDAKPLRCEYSHEIALRILVGKIAKELMLQDFGCLPLISFYKGHAIKSIVLAEKNAMKADESIKQLGYIMHCQKCLSRECSKRQVEKCTNCGGKYDYAGEMWIGKLQDSEFLKCMEKHAEKSGCDEKLEISRLLGLLQKENDFAPSFRDMHLLSSKYKIKIRKMEDALERLKKAGFKAARTHYSSTSIKTDAPIAKLVNILR